MNQANKKAVEKKTIKGASNGAQVMVSKEISEGASKGMSEGANERLRKTASGKLVLINQTSNRSDSDQSFLQK